MISTLKRAIARGALLVTAFFATAALAQAPSEAQRAAIKSQCRSDYMAHCSSVPPGGEASLQCLQKNMSSLSAGCASAVRAVEPQAAPRPRRNPRRPRRRRRRFPPQRPRSPPLSLPHPRPPQARRRNNPPARRHLRSAAPAAPITRKSALAFRRAARPPCNAWKRTRQNSRRPARRPSASPVAVRPRQAQFPPRRPRLPRPQLPRS